MAHQKVNTDLLPDAWQDQNGFMTNGFSTWTPGLEEKAPKRYFMSKWGETNEMHNLIYGKIRKMKKIPCAYTPNRDPDCYLWQPDDWSKPWLEVIDCQGYREGRKFNRGQMEAARRILKRDVLEPYCKYKIAKTNSYNKNKRMYMLITCYQFLSDIQGFLNGEYHQDIEEWNHEDSQHVAPRIPFLEREKLGIPEPSNERAPLPSPAEEQPAKPLPSPAVVRINPLPSPVVDKQLPLYERLPSSAVSVEKKPDSVAEEIVLPSPVAHSYVTCLGQEPYPRFADEMQPQLPLQAVVEDMEVDEAPLPLPADLFQQEEEEEPLPLPAEVSFDEEEEYDDLASLGGSSLISELQDVDGIIEESQEAIPLPPSPPPSFAELLYEHSLIVNSREMSSRAPSIRPVFKNPEEYSAWCSRNRFYSRLTAQNTQLTQPCTPFIRRPPPHLEEVGEPLFTQLPDVPPPSVQYLHSLHNSLYPQCNPRSNLEENCAFYKNYIDYVGSWGWLDKEDEDEEPPTAQAAVEPNFTKEINTTFVDETEIQQEQSTLNSQLSIPPTNQSMQEEEYHVRTMMSKPLILFTTPWSVNDDIDKVLWEGVVPYDVLTPTGIHVKTLSHFKFARLTCRARLQINTTNFNFGRLGLFFIPQVSEKKNYTVENLFATNQLMAAPHVIIDASTCNSGVLDIPFIHMQNYFDLGTTSDVTFLGKLMLIVFNKLGATTGAPQTVDCTLWISFPDCELHQIQAYSAPVFAHAAVEGLVKALAPMAIDTVTSGVKSFAGNVLGGSRNCDKPTDPSELPKLVPNTVTSLNFGDGLDKSNRLSLLPGSQTLSPPELLQTNKDDMDLKKLLQIPTRLTTAQWKTTSKTGSSIFSFCVCPNVCTKAYQSSDVSPAVDVWQPTLLAYFSRMFKYYRGSIRLKFQFIVNMLMSGRMQLSYCPFAWISSQTSAVAVNSVILDLREQHEIEFVIPYMSDHPWLRCDGFMTVEQTNASQGQFALGGFTLNVLNRLTAPDASAQTVDINVFIAAGDDFELAVISDLAFYQGSGLPIKEEKKKESSDEPFAQAMVTNLTDRQDKSSEPITFGKGFISSPSSNTMSENAMDLKTVIRRFSKVYENLIEDAGDLFLCFCNTPVLSSVNKPFNNNNGFQCRTILSHVTEPFTFWRGSLRYKFILTPVLTSIGHIVQVFHLPGVFMDPNFTGLQMYDKWRYLITSMESLGVMVCSSQIQNSMEFEIPFYSPYNMLRTHSTRSAYDSTGTIFIRIQGAGALYANLYQAAGDDFTLNYFRAVPYVQFYQDAEKSRDFGPYAPDLYSEAFLPMPKPVVDKKKKEIEANAEALVDLIPCRNPFTVAMDTLEAYQEVGRAAASTTRKTDLILEDLGRRLGVREFTSEEEDIFHEAVESQPETWTTLEGFMNALPGITNTALSLGAKVATLVTGFQAYLTAQNKFIKACAIVTIVKELFGNLINKLIDKMLPLAQTVIEMINGCKQGNQQPRAEAEVISYIAPLVALVTSALVVLGFKKMPDDKDTMKLIGTVNEKLKLFNMTSSALGNIKTMFTQMKELTEWVIDSILMLCAPQVLAHLKLERGFGDLENWALTIDRFEGDATIEKCNLDPEYRKEVLRACEKAHVYTSLLVRGKIGREGAVIREYARKCIEMEQKVRDAWTSLPVRRDPYCIALVGETAVGKSASVSKIAGELMDHLGYPKQNRWCPINPNEEFFTENYRHQTAIYIDDFGMFNSEDQYKTFINLKNNNSYPLNMAFRKGVKFASDFIFMTSNTMYPTPNFVTEHTALQRRRDALIEVKFKDDETKRLIRTEGRDDLRMDDLSHLLFRVKGSARCDNSKTGWVTYPRLMDYLKEATAKHFQRQNEWLRTELTRLGYDTTLVDPIVANAGTIKFDKERAYQKQELQCFSEELFDSLVWSEQQNTFVLGPGITDEEIKKEYDFLTGLRTAKDLQLEHINVGNDVERWIRGCRVYQTRMQNLKQKLSTAFTTLKTYLTNKWAVVKTKFSWLSCLESWPAKLAGVFLVLAGMTGLVAKVGHKCYCHSVRSYGYRCRFCGRWPDLKDCLNKEWMLQEWRTMYGAAEEYAQRVTTLQEEQDFFKLMGDELPDRPFLGTKERATAQAGPYSDLTKGAALNRVIPHHGPYNDITKGPAKQQIMAHGGNQTLDLVDNRIARALYRVRVLTSTEAVSMNALAVGGRWILVQKHFFDVARTQSSFEILHSGTWLNILIDPQKMQAWADRDLVMYEMPVQFHQHRDLTRHFISEQELNKLKVTDAILVTQGADGQSWLQRVTAKANDEVRYNLVMDDQTVTYFTRSSWKYKALTGSGTCGSVLVAMCDRVDGRLLGLHVAGNTNFGWATLITREMISRYVTKGKLGTPIPLAEAKFTSLIPAGHFGRIGLVDEGKGAYQPKRTSIIPTPIQGEVAPIKTAPAVLHQRDPRLELRVNILRECIRKYSSPPIQFNPRHRKMIQEDRRREFENWDLRRTPEVLTLKEAILGIPELEGFDRLPMATSPGYPWTLTRTPGVSGKAYLFDVEDGRISDRSLEKKFQERYEMALLGERVESIWTCCLKDERRPLEKVKAGSTRLFVIPPVDYSLLARMFTLDFSCAVKDNRRISHCKVGIDCQSLEWTELYEYITEFSPLMFAGDFSKYDGTLAPDLTFDFYEDQDYWYRTYGKGWSPSHSNVREVLADEGIHTICLAERELFVTHTGNKSGNPETVIKNSDVNDRMMKLAFLGLAERCGKKATLSEFHKYVRTVTYGDDNVVAVKQEVADWFNQESVSQFLAEYGITYTNASKTGISKMETIDSVTFLKQRFAKHESISGIRVPLIAEQTITELTNWTRIAPDQDVLLEDNCNDALRFAYFYGVDYFSELRTKIVSALRKHERKLNIMTYDDFHYWFLFVCGMLPSGIKPEAFFETISKSGNGRLMKLLNRSLFSMPYHLLQRTGLLAHEGKQSRTDDRYAIAIPSGEGKSWLCEHYPSVFVDHDEILLPAATEAVKTYGLSWSKIWTIFDKEYPQKDRRILLCHHEANTRRQMLGSYMLPKSNYIRANFYQRLRMKNAKVLERDERNKEILDLARKVEPGLFSKP